MRKLKPLKELRLPKNAEQFFVPMSLVQYYMRSQEQYERHARQEEYRARRQIWDNLMATVRGERPFYR